MKNIIIIIILYVAASYVTSAQYEIPLSTRPNNICEPCLQLHPDIPNQWQDGWPTVSETKEIKYGGCTFIVTYKKRCCGSTVSGIGCNGTQDVKIESIMPSNCTKDPFEKEENMSAREWFIAMQDMAYSIMTEFVRANPMEFTTNGIWQVLTPSCFCIGTVNGQQVGFSKCHALYAYDPLPNDPNVYSPPAMCGDECCIHKIQVSTDECGVVRMREAGPYSSGEGCGIGASSWIPNNSFKDGKTWKDPNIFYVDNKQYYYNSRGVNCIPLCGRQLTIVQSPSTRSDNPFGR